MQFHPFPSNGRFRDLSGQVFRMLTVLGYAGPDGFGHGKWYCRCECGNVIKVASCHLRGRAQVSCGCFNARQARETFTTHGESINGLRSPELRAFKQAKTRCNNPNAEGYENYGGRGIEFRFESFEQFLAEVGRKPTPQ